MATKGLVVNWWLPEMAFYGIAFHYIDSLQEYCSLKKQQRQNCSAGPLLADGSIDEDFDRVSFTILSLL